MVNCKGVQGALQYLEESIRRTEGPEGYSMFVAILNKEKGEEHQHVDPDVIYSIYTMRRATEILGQGLVRGLVKSQFDVMEDEHVFQINEKELSFTPLRD